MKKRIFALGLAMTMMLTACSSNGGNATTAAPAETKAAETTAAPAETKAAETAAPAETKAAETAAPAETKAEETTAAAADLPAWPFTDKEITFYTRNNAGSASTLGQQFLLDIMFADGGTNLLVSDPTSGGAVCVEQTYNAGGDGYTFYMSGTEMVIGDILGSFEYSLKDDFQVLGMIPSNGAPNFVDVSKVTLPDVTTLDQLVEYCKAHPGEVRFGYAPDTIGEVYCQLLIDQFDLDVKMTISEGKDTQPNLMGGIVDVVCWNQQNTLEFMKDYCTPVAAISHTRSERDELKDIPSYDDLGIGDCVVPSVMFIACKNDIDPALAQAINNKINAAIEDVNSDNPSEGAKILKDHMEKQNQTLQAMTIDECWDVINDEYEKIGAVLGGN